MTRHRKYEMVRALADAEAFTSWGDAGRALVSLTTAPNEAGAMLGIAQVVEFRVMPATGLVIAVRTEHGATWFLGRRR